MQPGLLLAGRAAGVTTLSDGQGALVLAGLNQVVQQCYSPWHKALLVSSHSTHTLHAIQRPLLVLAVEDMGHGAAACKGKRVLPRWCRSCLSWMRHTAGQHCSCPAGLACVRLSHRAVLRSLRKACKGCRLASMPDLQQLVNKRPHCRIEYILLAAILVVHKVKVEVTELQKQHTAQHPLQSQQLLNNAVCSAL